MNLFKSLQAVLPGSTHAPEMYCENIDTHPTDGLITKLLAVHGFALFQTQTDMFSLTFPETYTVPMLDTFLLEFAEFLVVRPKVPFTMVADASAVKKTNSLTRRRLATFFETQGDYFEQHCKALAIVTASAIQQGAITAIFWLRPNNWPTKVFHSPNAAEVWVRTNAEFF